MGSIPSESYILHLLRRAERSHRGQVVRPPVSVELRTLEFWRAVIGECLSTFVYVYLMCGAHVVWPLHSVNTLTKSFTSGFAMATAAHAFGHISGPHVNPALTLAMLAARRITVLRALFYAAAQCGGAIAGAALLYGMTSPDSIGGGREGLGCTMVSDSLSPLQAAGLETVLTFVVALTLFANADPDRKWSGGSDALALGIAYLACSLVALPATGASMNPARSLGPAFVMNTWTNHWVYWSGPATGGVLAGLIYEYILDSPRKVIVKEDLDKADTVDLRDENDRKSSILAPSVRPAQIHQATCPRASTDNPRPLSRGGQQGKYGQSTAQQTNYYNSLPKNSGSAAPYRTWGGSDYGSNQQFKF